MRAEPETGQVLLLTRIAANSGPTAEIALDTKLLSSNLVFGFEQMSWRAQPFLTIRSQLLKISQHHDLRVIAVTSGQPGNGKTHVAVNLAAALSHIHPTILIELDLRRPSIGSRLGLPPWLPGIDDFLRGDVGFLDSSIRIKDFNLCVHRVRNPIKKVEDLLATPNLKRLTDGIRGAEGAPLCIVDTPPVIIQDDLSRISRVIDGAVFVVEEGITNKRTLKEAETMLSPAPIVGTVLNRSVSTFGSRAQYDYSYYYTDGTP